MRKHGRVDKNQKEIVDALRKAGATVLSLADVGNGCPDLLVSFRDELYLMEIKDESGKLTSDEANFFDAWGGNAYIVRTVETALKIIGAI